MNDSRAVTAIRKSGSRFSRMQMQRVFPFSKRRKIMKQQTIFFAIAAILLAFSTMNAQEDTLEYKDIDLGSGVKLVNKNVVEKNTERLFEISADYPQVVGTNSPGAVKFNKTVQDLIGERNQEFREWMMSLDAEELKFHKERGIESYSEIGYSVQFAGKDLVSISFGNSYYTGGAHPNLDSFAITFDLKNGKPLELSDLFLPGSNFLKFISDFSISTLKKQTKDFSDDEWIAGGAGPKIENFKSWYLTKDTLEIIFDQYQVAAYVAGPQYVSIPFEKLRPFLRVFNIAPLQYANTGNPVNWCRNGLFPKDGENFRIAKVKAATNEKVFFYSDDRSECPGSSNCKTRSYIVPNDEVIVSQTYGNYACSWYQPRKGSETVGWIELDKLSFQTAAQNFSWIGTWRDGENEIKIAPMKIAGKFKITGNAFWRGTGDNIHIGEIDFAGSPENNKMNLGEPGEYECRVKMQRVGKFLIVSDNLNCGGANVSFTGIFEQSKN